MSSINCPTGYICGEKLPKDGYSQLPYTEGPDFMGEKYELVSQNTSFTGKYPLLIEFINRPHLTRDLTIFSIFRQHSMNEGYLVAKGVSAHSRDYGLYLRSTHNTIWFVYKTITGFHEYIIFDDVSIDDLDAHSIAVVVLQAEFSRNVYLYVDGIPLGYKPLVEEVIFTSSVNKLYVGGRPGTNQFNFIGTIRSLIVWDTALSYDVIHSLHTFLFYDNIVRYCMPLGTQNEDCYIEDQVDLFQCEQGLKCVPSTKFNTRSSILTQYNPYYGTPYTEGICLSCNCTLLSDDKSELVCGSNGVTYSSECFRRCSNVPSILSSKACEIYSDLFEITDN